MRFERTICKQVDYSKEIALFALAKYMLVWVAANKEQVYFPFDSGTNSCYTIIDVVFYSILVF